jgi:hypothetical protein
MSAKWLVVLAVLVAWFVVRKVCLWLQTLERTPEQRYIDGLARQSRRQARGQR